MTMNKITVIQRLRSHVGELLIAVETERGRKRGQIKLQKLW